MHEMIHKGNGSPAPAIHIREKRVVAVAMPMTKPATVE
jgi:hypothetical protein